MWGEQTGSCSQSKIFSIFRLFCSEHIFQRPHVFHDRQREHRTPCPRPLLRRSWNSTDDQRKPAVGSYSADSLWILLNFLFVVDVVRFMAAGVFSKCMTSLNDYCCRDPFVHHRINDDIKKWIRKVSRIIKFSFDFSNEHQHFCDHAFLQWKSTRW